VTLLVEKLQRACTEAGWTVPVKEAEQEEHPYTYHGITG
jgi:hypothetical protein